MSVGEQRPSGPEPVRKHRSFGMGRSYRHAIVGYVMVLPTMAVLLAFMYYPALQALTFSFTDWNGIGIPSFVGLANYVSAVQDPNFVAAVVHVFIWMGVGLLIGLVPAFIVAELIFSLKNSRHQALYRSLFVLQMGIPILVMLMMWGFIYQPNVGLLNSLLNAVGLSGLAHDWLGNPHLALASLMLMGLPWVSGFNLLVYSAGLHRIPPEVLEAARLDGVSSLKRTWLIDLPLVLSETRTLAILILISVVQIVTIPLVLTQGGPVNATMMPGLYVYVTAFTEGRMAYSLAIGSFVFVVTMGLTLLTFRFVKPSTEYR